MYIKKGDVMKQKTINLPNILTTIRILLVPIIIVLLLVDHYMNGLVFTNFSKFAWFISGAIFIIASLTDFLDGWIARKYNLVTNFGKFFDPIADKLLVNATLILFSSLGVLPIWMTVVLILRDTFIDFIRMILSSKGITLAAGMGGKLKTTFQMIGLSLLFFINLKIFGWSEWDWQNQLVLIPMYIATFFSIYSGVIYFLKARSNLF
ncbi:CDP-diacylglycerol--glycerol-3-phosphate 3-phosphatidyltransferase [Mycoplasma mycoides subsp. capri]|uniref:CDP-diacylglycerol--glycerol-3-phosphate 3-phosphatidyltransferase n=2 Tax=Mycoplasma mycoides TaxID=2102 RepID=A0AB38GF05_MYCMC|nr:CDP-diacylglycerol--glycerol-3-phosphate 3-phosphatidyltransferase [Mycoplasma mycoides subsp. capri]SRX62020.1 CDP-diacylglycerol--glycerol-3-phosphate 3-phosphatidyltransferase [Mycoplasma mycoides subsp. capri]SRX63569.1 CDP-diacylglycerol--glycerol-3-phosphate 3-phosphatidyltransferase [Mycoplasma mycoides subsp. capri]SRX64643.1 CDP-diacylglycerol--glycerol-3-phosphate 3-phosphatidyltransferase [Mycoplasma mycoides subsp. capri]SRX65117.1 CDP-diacylglycerol--glycerol-3-phosphate 3-phosp